jgi:hypothetical protein
VKSNMLIAIALLSSRAWWGWVADSPVGPEQFPSALHLKGAICPKSTVLKKAPGKLSGLPTDIPTDRFLQFSMFRLGPSANGVPDCP